MDTQLKMALKILNLKSPNASPKKQSPGVRDSVGQKYRTGSQGILKRNNSLPPTDKLCRIIKNAER